MNRDISIFFDTNTIQLFFNGKNGSDVFLGKLGISPEYYKLVEFIDRNNLSDRVEICIPEIVVLEMKEHMIRGFSDRLQILKDQLTDHTKAFGDTVGISPIQEKYKIEEYENVVMSLFDDFFKHPRNFTKQVPYPRDGSTMDVLIKKAVSGARPFFSGRVGSKQHSDAGFKDSVLAETIFKHHTDTNSRCIFITRDNDFCEEFKNEIGETDAFVRFSSVDDAITAMRKYYKIPDTQVVSDKFSGDEYLRCRLLEEAGVEFDASLTDFRVEEVTSSDDNTFIVKVWFAVNEVEYRFTVLYDYSANAIIEAKYRIMND